MANSKLHIAMLVSPGMGHLIPSLNLANRLVDHHNVQITLLIVTTDSSLANSQLRPLLDSKSIKVIEIPPPDISSLVNPTSMMIDILSIIMREVKPAVRAAISDMPSCPDVLIADLFCTEYWPIADEFKMGKYLYVPTNAWFVALTTYTPILDTKVDGQYVDQTEPLLIPGCKPVQPEDVIDPMLDRNMSEYREYLRMGNEYPLFDGILLNTWEDLDRTTLQAFRDEKALLSVVKVPVYPIGPLTKSTEPVHSKTELIKWLDEQPDDSVLYVSFGSGGTLSAEQITELAYGLELSRVRFIWIVRPPVNGASDGSFFNVGKGDHSDGTPKYLPSGFSTRTSDFGRVVPNWAPQLKILNHKSVGGFLTHCGWNSTLESIKCGVPMIAWPLYAEQRLNAAMLAEELRVALRPAVLPAKKVVGRNEVEELVRGLIEGNEGSLVRKRVRELMVSGENALNKNGSSYKSTSQFISKCCSEVVKNSTHN